MCDDDVHGINNALILVWFMQNLDSATTEEEWCNLQALVVVLLLFFIKLRRWRVSAMHWSGAWNINLICDTDTTLIMVKGVLNRSKTLKSVNTNPKVLRTEHRPKYINSYTFRHILLDQLLQWSKGLGSFRSVRLLTINTKQRLIVTYP